MEVLQSIGRSTLIVFIITDTNSVSDLYGKDAMGEHGAVYHRPMRLYLLVQKQARADLSGVLDIFNQKL